MKYVFEGDLSLDAVFLSIKNVIWIVYYRLPNFISFFFPFPPWPPLPHPSIIHNHGFVNSEMGKTC